MQRNKSFRCIFLFKSLATGNILLELLKEKLLKFMIEIKHLHKQILVLKKVFIAVEFRSSTTKYF